MAGSTRLGVGSKLGLEQSLVGRDDSHDPTEDDPTGGEETDDDGESAKRGLSEREVTALMRDFSVGRLTAAKMGYAWLQMIRCSGTPLGEFAQELTRHQSRPATGTGGAARPVREILPVPLPAIHSEEECSAFLGSRSKRRSEKQRWLKVENDFAVESWQYLATLGLDYQFLSGVRVELNYDTFVTEKRR